MSVGTEPRTTDILVHFKVMLYPLSDKLPVMFSRTLCSRPRPRPRTWDQGQEILKANAEDIQSHVHSDTLVAYCIYQIMQSNRISNRTRTEAICGTTKHRAGSNC